MSIIQTFKINTTRLSITNIYNTFAFILHSTFKEALNIREPEWMLLSISWHNHLFDYFFPHRILNGLRGFAK